MRYIIRRFTYLLTYSYTKGQNQILLLTINGREAVTKCSFSLVIVIVNHTDLQ